MRLALSGPVIAALLTASSVGAAPQEPRSTAPDATSAPADQEPLPAGAPQQPYELAAWCYGAMDQYLYIYAHILPELRDIDRRFGSSVKDEAEPYAADMAAARQELKVLSGAVTAAERASAQVIAPQGVDAVRAGRAIWIPAEQHTKRELARAWLSWALPDRCDANARELTAKSQLLGQVLKGAAPSATDDPPAAVTTPAAGELSASQAEHAAEPPAAPPSKPSDPSAPVSSAGAGPHEN